MIEYSLKNNKIKIINFKHATDLKENAKKNNLYSFRA